MSKTIVDYAAEEPTGQAQAFAEWVTTETGLVFKSRTAQQAFERGLFLGVRGYALFQAANREAFKPRPRRKAAK